MHTQNIQNDCHQWLSYSSRVHQLRFRPDPTAGVYSAPQTSSWFNGPYMYL